MILRNRSVKIDDDMLAGEKRLRCNSLVRAESTPGTLAALGPFAYRLQRIISPTTTSLVGNQSSCASIFKIKHGRGTMRGIALLKARIRCKLTVHIPDGCIGGDKASLILSSHIGALIRHMSHFRQVSGGRSPARLNLSYLELLA
ncbi:hypothetical protein CJ030_MR3G018313 [Morella rubra]|uniref:Uncharacterized protein n=1 Tax=Morella rubra TaxID=262757 RepID=A0A6A1W7G0_9ROSI|nr:hypothetical protein CJ030_MR3G018313 [Morella rubra]